MNKKLFIIFAFIVSVLSGECQKRSGYEWRWAFTHPFAAIRVKSISKKCYAMYSVKSGASIPDSFSNGGKLDAYRHIFFMACFAQKVKPHKLRKLGIAHEKGNKRQFTRSQLEDGEIPDSLSSVMDLQNNDIGIEIGKNNKSLTPDAVEKIVLETIKSGNAVIMKRKRNGIYLDCNGVEIDLKNYLKIWSIPKCIVKSDYVYR